MRKLISCLNIFFFVTLSWGQQYKQGSLVVDASQFGQADICLDIQAAIAQDRTTNHANESDQSGFRVSSVIQNSRMNRCARLLQSHPGFVEEKESEAFDAFDSSPV